ncbi:uncharacterized protein [Penaeus vannamei]|uniref:uncharacterized protein n=1 Tax=Penaeus vannamei TaxID=6689 RepID=UPI00387FA0ED
MSFKFMDILSHVTKGLGMIMNMQDTKRIAGRNQGHVDEALQIIRRQQQNIEQLMKDRQQQEMVMERLLNLFEKMDRDATGPSAIDSNRMQNASLVLSFPEDSQDSNSIIQSLYWTLHNAVSHSRGSDAGRGPGRALLQLNNDEDNLSGVDSFGHDSVHSFEQVPVILRCDRCSDKFNQKERQPIVLTGCGHTVCRMCIQKERRQDRFMCSKCSIISRDLEELPVNRTLYEILEEEGRGESQGRDSEGTADASAAGLPPAEEEERQAMLEQYRRIKGAESEGKRGEGRPEGGDVDEGLSLKKLSLSDDEDGAWGFSDASYAGDDKEWARRKLEEEEEEDRDEEEQEKKRRARLRKRMIKLQRIEQEELELALALSQSLQEAQSADKES